MKNAILILFALLLVNTVAAQDPTEIKNETIEISIYPNPAASIVTLDFKDRIPTEVVIYDQAGRDVFSKKGLSKALFRIELSMFDEGMYYVVTMFDETMTTSKLVVTRK